MGRGLGLGVGRGGRRVGARSKFGGAWWTERRDCGLGERCERVDAGGLQARYGLRIDVISVFAESATVAGRDQAEDWTRSGRT